MNQKDTYDIIVENLTKEWELSMNNQIPQEKWEIPVYSKSEINKAGSTVANPNIFPEERHAALEVLNNWRSSHAYPLQVISSNLRRTNPNAIVVQRLKRLESIIGKLERFPEMNLYRMQDLGGCRVIVDNIDQVYEALNRYKNSRIRHILKRENDYIKNPKTSGYRSYHIVYQFQSDTKETYNKNMLIEVQFRTKLQHMWATAVEMMGIYTKSQLKASIGNKDILRFFVLVSSVFCTMENMPVVPNTSDDLYELIKEIKDIDEKHNIVSRLSALSVAINHVNKNANLKRNGYYVLQLNYGKKLLKVNSFSKSQVELATNVYNKIEGLNNPDLDVVLVSATSFDALKAAYPNYFTDISGFVDMMRKISK
ncbi:RelA/SpoT domain-containing protein [Lacrimispora indolis]|uniref:RelA/SpoT domain-containing protein n=1 Tax=Lacrimispora indolis TaxID=69825 RepID=UPI0004016D0D|nr:RelA/SpoT domain-containing protein [[Clostridium] methoxybenzovorans]